MAMRYTWVFLALCLVLLALPCSRVSSTGGIVDSDADFVLTYNLAYTNDLKTAIGEGEGTSYSAASLIVLSSTTDFLHITLLPTDFNSLYMAIRKSLGEAYSFIPVTALSSSADYLRIFVLPSESTSSGKSSGSSSTSSSQYAGDMTSLGRAAEPFSLFPVLLSIVSLVILISLTIERKRLQ